MDPADPNFQSGGTGQEMIRTAEDRERLADPGLMLSVVIPIHNEESGIEALFGRLSPVLDDLDVPSEVICVDDGSRDASLALLKRCRKTERRLKIVSLSRNFGKEAALAAGLQHSRGDAVVLMDGDLQHPPEAILEFVRLWREGYLMVYARRLYPGRTNILRHLITRWFYALFAWLGDVQLPPDAGDFRLLDRRVVDMLNSLGERTRFTKGLYAWVGFHQIGIDCRIAERHAGASSWSLRRLCSLGLDALTAFSIVPLRVSTFLGLFVSVCAIAYGGLIVLRTLIYGIEVPGYASIIVAIMLLSGIQLISLGVIGEYIGRIFTEVKRRPLYLVAEAIGFDEWRNSPLVPTVDRPLAERVG